MKKTLCIAMILFLLLSGAMAFAEGEKEKAQIKLAHFYDPMGGGALKANYDWFQKLIADFEKTNRSCFSGIRLMSNRCLTIERGLRITIFFCHLPS